MKVTIQLNILIYLTILNCSDRLRITRLEDWPTNSPISHQNIGLVFLKDQKVPFLEEGGLMLDQLHSLSFHARGTEKAMWLCKSINVTQQSAVAWKILDIVEIPHLARRASKRFVIRHECQLNGKTDTEIIAAANFDCGSHRLQNRDIRIRPDGSLTEKVKYAWRADRKAGKLIPISTEDVECFIPPCSDY